MIPQGKAECCRYTLAQLWNKELKFVANKVASPLVESHTFLASKVRNLVTRLCTVPDITYQYPTNLVARLPSSKASGHFQSFLSFLGV